MELIEGSILFVVFFLLSWLLFDELSLLDIFGLVFYSCFGKNIMLVYLFFVYGDV